MPRGKPRAGKIIRETETIFPEIDHTLTAQQQAEMEAERNGEGQEEEEIDVPDPIAKWANSANNEMKMSLYRISNEGDEEQIATLDVADIPDPDNAVEYIKERFGGGKFRLKGKVPDTDIVINKSYTIAGAQKAGIHGVNINMIDPKSLTPENTPAMMLPLVFQQMAQLQQSQTEVIVAALKSRNNEPASTPMTVKEVVEIVKMLKTESGPNWPVWIPVIKDAIKEIGGFFGGASADPKFQLYQLIAEKVGQIATMFADAKAKTQANAPRPMPTAERVPTGAPLEVQAPTNHSAEQNPRPNGNGGLETIIQVFEQMYLPELIKAAEANADPWSLTFNFKAQLAGDTSAFFSYLGLRGPEDFYKKYPQSERHREWFQELFWYLLNPSAKPEDYDSETERESEGEVVS